MSDMSIFESPVIRDCDSDKEKHRQSQERVFEKNLRPLLFCMKLFGIYFEYNVESTIPLVDHVVERRENVSKKLKIKCVESEKIIRTRVKGILPKIYSTVLLLMMWMQFARMLTIFVRRDQLILVVAKLIIVCYTLMCTLMFSAYYVSSITGSFARTLRQIPIVADCEISIRKRVIVYTLCAWILGIVLTVFISYIMIFSSQIAIVYLIAPFCQNPPDCGAATRLFWNVLAIVVSSYMNAAWAFTAAATMTITASFTIMFRDVNKKVKSAIKSDGSFEGNLEKFRLKHQRISRLADKTDKFLTLYITAAVVFNIATIVLVLYFLIFNTYYTPLIYMTMAFWIVASGVSLIITVCGSIKVNNAAHKLYEKLPSIDLSALDSETIGAVNVFLKSLSGSSIGFTVIRIFVIDRDTILTIVGLMITYFLLIIQLATPSCVLPSSTSPIGNSTSLAI